MSRPIRILLTVAILGLACSAGAMIMVLLNRSQSPIAADNQPIPVAEMGLRILPFALTDQQGEARTEEALRGKWTLAEFIFTNCPGACPVMTSRMAQISAQIGEVPLQYASFSLDQERDTPEQLRQFASNYDIDPEKWILLTGDDARVRQIVEEGLSLIVDNENTAEITITDGSTMKNITHPTRLFLIGPDLNVVEMYDSGNPAEVDRAVSDIRRLVGSE